MKLLKTVGYIIAGLILVVLLLGLIAPNEVSTSRSTVINASQETVFSLVNELPTWERWSPWQRRDATIKNTYSEKTVGAGAYYTWTSENSGAGQLTITGSYGPDSLHTEIDFNGQGVAYSNWYFAPVDNGTEVTWNFQSASPFPWNAFLLFQDVEGMLNKDYEEGLAFLKTEAESILPEGPALAVEPLDFPATRYVGIRKVINMADLTNHFQAVMPEVGTKVAEQGVEMAGAPSALYYLWDEETQKADLAIVIPVAAGVTVDGLEVIDLPANSAVQVDYVGNYDGIMAAHLAIDAYLKTNTLTSKLPVIESYLADPGPETEPDPNKWMSQVTYLLEQ